MHDGQCLAVAEAFATAQTISVANSLVIVVVNLLLVGILRILSKFQRFATRSEELSFVASRLLVSQAVNTGLIILLVNAHFKFAESLPSAILGGLFVEGFKSFDSGWYAAVGVGVCFSATMNVVVPHVLPLLEYYVQRPFYRVWCQAQATT